MNKRKLGDWLRKKADRIDPEGAPRHMGWSFSFEHRLGTVFNEGLAGCPLWYFPRDYHRAHDESALPHQAAHQQDGDPKWIAIGFPHLDEVMVYGSAEISEMTLTRSMDGYDNVPMPRVKPVAGTPVPRVARVPRWTITMNCKMKTWVQVTGPDFQSALQQMFSKGGRSGN